MYALLYIWVIITGVIGGVGLFGAILNFPEGVESGDLYDSMVYIGLFLLSPLWPIALAVFIVYVPVAYFLINK